ncbi:MAG: DMT family transporter, partial [Deltaproteobacteria bacterium]|nr:DMT family transporter [Deltaproteobacteria bacterium]
AVAAGLLYAGYGLAVRQAMANYSSVAAFAAISQWTAAATGIAMLGFGRDHGASALALPAGQFGLLLLSSVIGIALGHVFYYMAMARLGVAVTAGVLQLQPFTVAVGSWWLFGQTLGGAQLATGVLAVAGAVLLVAQPRAAAADPSAKRSSVTSPRQ